MREKLGLSIKEAAQRLKVPQRQIKAIEAGRLDAGDGDVLRRFVELLGIGRWVNGELAAKIGLSGRKGDQA